MATTQTTDKPGSRVQTVEQSTDEEENHTICPECGGEVISSGVERICSECSLVVDEDDIDHGPDWRSYEGDENSARASPMNPTHSGDGMGSEIGWKQSGNSNKQGRLRRAETHTGKMSKEKQRRGKAIGDIKQVGSAIELPSTVVDQACMLFKQYHKQEDVTGRAFERIIGGVVYLTAKVHDTPILTNQLAEQLSVKEKFIYKEAQRVADSLDLKVPLTTPSQIIPRVVSDLDGDRRTELFARKLADVVEDKNLHNGSSPSGVAAAIVYITFRHANWEERRTQEQVADVSGVSKVTIRNQMRKLEEESVTGDAVDINNIQV